MEKIKVVMKQSNNDNTQKIKRNTFERNEVRTSKKETKWRKQKNKKFANAPAAS